VSATGGLEWKCIGLLLAVLILAGCATGLRETAGLPRELVIAVVADPHVAPDGYRWSHAPKGQVSEQRVRRYLKSIADYHPDFMVVLGDLIAVDASAQETEPMWRLYQKAFLSLPFPVYSCLGNHDWEWREGAAKADLFKKYIGNRTRAWHKKGVLCLILDPHLKPPPRDISRLPRTLGLAPKQLAWMKEQLDEVPVGSKVLVFYHEPMVDWSRGVAELVDLCGRYDAHLFAGHYHYNAQINYKGIPERVVGAISGSWWHGPNRDGSPPGFLLLRVGRRVEYRWIPLE